MSNESLNAEIKRFQAEINNVAKQTDEGAKAAVAKTVKLFERTMKNKCPKGQSWRARSVKQTLTGSLAKSINGDVYNNGLSGFVGTTLIYAPFVEFGTKAHVIKPKVRRFLRWVAGGHAKGKSKGLIYAFAKTVHHPGTRPQPFVEPTLKEKSNEAIGYFDKGIEEALK